MFSLQIFHCMSSPINFSNISILNIIGKQPLYIIGKQPLHFQNLDSMAMKIPLHFYFFHSTACASAQNGCLKFNFVLCAFISVTNTKLPIFHVLMRLLKHIRQKKWCTVLCSMHNHRVVVEKRPNNLPTDSPWYTNI